MDGDCAALLALCCYFGFGTVINYQRKEHWCHVAIASMTLLGQGVGYFFTDQFDKSAVPLRILAEAGVSVAQNLFGHQMIFGRGVVEDRPGGAEMNRQASQQGYSPGTCDLAACLKFGFGVEIDPEKAVTLYRQAVSQGLSTAYNNLGRCYEDGFGVTKDLKEAFCLFQKAAWCGYPSGWYNLGYCYDHGEGVGMSRREARRCFEIAAALGDDEAMKILMMPS